MPRARQGYGSSPRITPANDRLIEAVVNGKARNADELATLTGITRRGVYKALEKPHIQAEIERRSRKQLRGFALPRAINVMADLLNAQSEYVRADMSKHIAAIHGVKPKSDGTQIPSGGIMVRLVINGQALNVGAIAGQFSTQSAHGEPIEPQVIEHTRQLEPNHLLDKAAGQRKGGRADE